MKTQEQIIHDLKIATARMTTIIVVLTFFCFALMVICHYQSRNLDRWEQKNVQVFRPIKIVTGIYIDTVWLRDTTVYDTIKYKIK